VKSRIVIWNNNTHALLSSCFLCLTQCHVASGLIVCDVLIVNVTISFVLYPPSSFYYMKPYSFVFGGIAKLVQLVNVKSFFLKHVRELRREKIVRV